MFIFCWYILLCMIQFKLIIFLFLSSCFLLLLNLQSFVFNERHINVVMFCRIIRLMYLCYHGLLELTIEIEITDLVYSLVMILWSGKCWISEACFLSETDQEVLYIQKLLCVCIYFCDCVNFGTNAIKFFGILRKNRRIFIKNIYIMWLKFLWLCLHNNFWIYSIQS